MKILIKLPLLRLGQKKEVVSRNQPSENLSPTCIVDCVSGYIFLISKNKQAKKSKTKQEYKKTKETKEEKRTFPENRLKK